VISPRCSNPDLNVFSTSVKRCHDQRDRAALGVWATCPLTSRLIKETLLLDSGLRVKLTAVPGRAAACTYAFALSKTSELELNFKQHAPA